MNFSVEAVLFILCSHFHFIIESFIRELNDFFMFSSVLLDFLKTALLKFLFKQLEISVSKCLFFVALFYDLGEIVVSWKFMMFVGVQHYLCTKN